MRNTLIIAWKETRTYFTTPTAYIVALVFLALTGWFFVRDILGASLPEASIRGFLTPTTFIMVLLAPVLTMRLLAEEQKLGTLELLLTSPVRDWEIVVGKFLSSFIFYLVALALTLYYVLLLYWFGKPDSGPILAGYLGMILYGAATLSVGLLASSFSGNQIVGAVVGFGILLILTVIDQAGTLVSGTAAIIVEQVSITFHFDDFTRGVIDVQSIIYYISVTVLFLFLTVRSLESRRWR
ncbi:MAG: ABC transporter permease [Chloroflexota bacterium]|nr:ABC transporter permease [Chloroflexota bacterium]